MDGSRLLKALALTLSLAAMALAGTPASAPGGVGMRQYSPSQIVTVPSPPPGNSIYFVTPGELAWCVFYGDVAKSGYTPWLTCGRELKVSRPSPRRVKVTLKATGRPWFEPSTVFSPLSQPRLAGTVRFGESWWGNKRGEWGTGRSRGRVLFRCASRETGLTCSSSISGRGFWLGRTRGHRVF